jgi:hypothetical protein
MSTFVLAGRAAAKYTLGALALRDIDVGKDLLILRGRRYRTDLRLGEGRIPKPGGLRHGDELLNKLIVDRLLQQQTGARDARLPCGRENTGNRAADGVVQDTVIKYDVGRLAAEFQRNLFESLGRQLVDPGAGGAAAGEGDLGDFWMGHQRFADDRTISGHDIDNARGQARFRNDQLHELEQ